MIFLDNPILMTDHYKTTQWKQYPKKKGIFSYLEARKGEDILLTGITPFIEEFMMKRITHEHVDQAVKVYKNYGGEFNEKGFRRIVDEFNGYWPVRIKSAVEGKRVDPRVPLVTIECLHEDFIWVNSYIETVLIRSVWFPTTVLSNVSFQVLKTIYENLLKTGSEETANTRLHDFGARGTSSHESAMIGGAAHLMCFTGSDTVEAVPFIQYYYRTGEEYNPAWAPHNASEHSTITSWGRERELEGVKNQLDMTPNDGVVSIVVDSYNCFELVENIIKKFGHEIEERNLSVVFRPDSGVPEQVLNDLFLIIDNLVPSTTNTKGYKVLHKNYRLLWGDGISKEKIKDILNFFEEIKISGDNFYFGMGGKLLQSVSRDDLSFAFKCSAVLEEDGSWTPVFKEPITDSGKSSKRGRVGLSIKTHVDGTPKESYTLFLDKPSESLDVVDHLDFLQTVWEPTITPRWTPSNFNKSLFVNEFEEIRKNVKLSLLTYYHGNKDV